MILLSRTAFTQQHQHNHHNAEVDVVGKIHDDSPECHAAQSAGCAIWPYGSYYRFVADTAAFRRQLFERRRDQSKHDALNTPCPLFPQKRTWLSETRMSAKCQKRTLAPRVSPDAFHHARHWYPRAGPI
jgi:hypothetical protein